MSSGGTGVAAVRASGDMLGTELIIALSIGIPAILALFGGLWYYKRRRAAKKRAQPQVWRDTKRVRKRKTKNPLLRWIPGMDMSPVKKPPQAKVKDEKSPGEDSPV